MSRLIVPQDTWELRAGRLELYAFLRDLSNRIVSAEFTWNPPELAANTTTNTVLTSATSKDFSDLRTIHTCTVSPPNSIDTGVVVGGAWCATNGELTIRLGNLTGSAINPASGTWLLFAYRT